MASQVHKCPSLVYFDLVFMNYCQEQAEAPFLCFAGDVSSVIALQAALKFNGGGHINHSIFWTNLSPEGGGEPTGNFN